MTTQCATAAFDARDWPGKRNPSSTRIPCTGSQFEVLRYPVALANFNQVFSPRRSALALQSI